MIRLGTHDDIVKLMPLFLEWKKDSKLPLGEINPHKLIGEMVKVVDEGFLLLSEDDSGINGFIALKVGEHWYSNDKFMGDIAFYVRPYSRSQGVAKALRNEAANIANKLNIPIFIAKLIRG